jgi:hypothetical protein
MELRWLRAHWSAAPTMEVAAGAWACCHVVSLSQNLMLVVLLLAVMKASSQ